jgi:predicted transcriptional regulator
MAKTLKKLLGNQSHWTINKELARQIGLNETLILQHLIDWSSYHKTDTIFQTYEQMKDELGIAHNAVKVAVANLNKIGFISIERKGIGMKNHYTINETMIWDFLTTPSSEVKMTSPVRGVENHSAGEVNITSPIVENDIAGELKIASPIVENHSANSNNILNNNVDEEYMTKECISNEAEAGFYKNIIEKTIVDVLTAFDADDKDYNNAINELKELGGIDKLSEIMEWDESVKENHLKQFKNVNLIRRMNDK